MTITIPFKFCSRILFNLPKNHLNCITFCNFQVRGSQITYHSKSASFLYLSNGTSRWYSSNNKTDEDKKVESVTPGITATKLNQRARFKQAIRDYGATIVVFHIAFALTSLGLTYIAISNGVDAVRLLTFIGFSESVISSKVAIGGSTFVISYAVYKLFAPVRIAITLSVAPLIVRYLRRIRWIKPPKNKE